MQSIRNRIESILLDHYARNERKEKRILDDEITVLNLVDAAFYTAKSSCEREQIINTLHEDFGINVEITCISTTLGPMHNIAELSVMENGSRQVCIVEYLSPG